MPTINEAAVLRFYVDAQEYSDRITAIEAQAASSIATHKTEVAAAIAQVNLTQSQTITALTLEVNTLKTNLTNSITATQTDLINRADRLAQEVTDITEQLTQDKATFTQEIQDALDFLKDDASVASALRTPRKIQGVDFDGTKDISLPTFTTQTDGLVPKRIGATADNYLREDGTWVVPTDTTYALLTKASAEGGTATAANTISAQVLKEAIQYHTPTVTNIVGNAGTATKLQTPRTINGISFDGTQDISLPESVAYSLPTATASVLGGIKVGSGLAMSNSILSVGTLNQSTTGNAATSTKLQTPRTISLTGKVTGNVSFDGSANVSITTAITGLGAANGIATLDSNGQVPSTQLPSYVDDVLEYINVAAFPTTGVAGKIYVETAGNTTYRWGGTGYVKITSGEVASVAGKTGVVTLTKTDVGLDRVDNTTDSAKNVASAAKLITARMIGGVSFDGTSNINLPGVNTAGNQNTSGNAASATKLQTARTIGGVSFDGSANINLPGVNTAGNQNTTGNAATATKLQTARTIAISGAVTGTATGFDGSSDIAIATTALDGSKISTGTIPAARIPTLNQSTTGNAATASKLATPVQINGVNFDGSQSIDIVISGGGGGSTSYADTAGKLANPVQIHGVNFDGSTGFDIPNFTASKSGVVPAAGADTTKYLRSDGTWQVPTNTAYTTITSAEVNTGTATTSKLVTAALLKQAVTAHTPLVTNITGNAGTATKLVTARKINGIDFDGTGDINLDVYSKNEVDTAISNATLTIPNATPTIPNATETIAGKAKIATTAIAQAGVNDTDILTAKKLRVALNASGDAPVSACRAWVCFNGKASPPEILASLNISSVVKNATGDYTLNFTTPLENSNYAVSCGGVRGILGNKYYPGVKALGSEDEPMLKTPTQLGIACVSLSTPYLIDMSEIYVEVFC